jgi:hypothetical protein
LANDSKQQRRQHQAKQATDNPATDVLGIHRAPCRLRRGSHADSFNGLVERVTPRMNCDLRQQTR